MDTETDREIIIPWPPVSLKPNSRTQHRYSKADRNKYRSDCMYCAMGKVPEYTDTIALEIIFYPPDKRRRDLDNMLASIKHGIDGVADAWGVDDRIFRPITIDIAEPVKNGKIIIKTKGKTNEL